jgi:hypothetical protein
MYEPGCANSTVRIRILAILHYRRTTLYGLPTEKDELELVASTFTMSCNVLLQDCTHYTRTLPFLADLEAAVRQTSVV